MPLPKKLLHYRRHEEALNQCLMHHGLRLGPFPTEGQAIRFRQMAYTLRQRQRDDTGGTPWDNIVISLDGNYVVMRVMELSDIGMTTLDGAPVESVVEDTALGISVKDKLAEVMEQEEAEKYRKFRENLEKNRGASTGGVDLEIDL